MNDGKGLVVRFLGVLSVERYAVYCRSTFTGAARWQDSWNEEKCVDCRYKYGSRGALC